MLKPKTEEKRYILIRNGTPIILNDQDELIKSFNSNLKYDSDQYFEIGPEVEVQVSVKPKGIVFRGAQ